MDAKGNGIDCHEVMQRLYEYLDEEIESAELVERIRAHLEICQRCYPQYRFERAFLRFLQHSRVAAAPTELRRRIFERILEEERRETGV
jgi:anti-sigma factor (TIGR02949 family)